MVRAIPAHEVQGPKHTTIYTSEDSKGEPQLAIIFATTEEKNAFLGSMMAEGSRTAQDLSGIFVNYSPAACKIFINSSKHGGPGVVAEQGELSINFGNEATRDKFQSLLGLTEAHARAGRGEVTIRFNKELITSEPDPRGRRNIKIKWAS